MAHARGSWLALAAALSLLLSCSAVFGSATIHVDARNKASGSGTPVAPYQSLQAAVDAASSGDTIRVAAGSYAPITVKGKTVFLYGGFPGGSAADYAAGKAGDFGAADRDKNETRIAGTGSENVITLDEAGDTRIDGFFISGGKRGISSDGWPFDKQHPIIHNNVIENNKGAADSEGGAIWCKTRITVTQNIIRGNHAGKGAGMAGFSVEMRIEGNVIQDNIGLGDHGGGLYIGADELVIARNLVSGNVTGYNQTYGVGGGILVLGKGTKATLAGNVITGNKAPKRGAGIFIDDEAEATITNELVYANGCGNAGGAGIAVDGLDENKPSHVTLVNVTVTGHKCPGQGNGLQVENAQATVSSSIFWDNGDDFVTMGNAKLSVHHTLAKENIDGEGNVSADPLFADVAAGDFHLRSTVGRFKPGKDGGSWVQDKEDSPGIDAGDPKGEHGLELSPSGNRVDLGAFGNTSEASKSKRPGGSDKPVASNTPALGPSGMPSSIVPPPPGSAAPGASSGCAGCHHAGGDERAGWWPIASALLLLRRRRAIKARGCTAPATMG